MTEEALAEARRVRALRAGLDTTREPAQPRHPVPYSGLDRPEFADLAKAIAAWTKATNDREDKQDAYEDAEDA